MNNEHPVSQSEENKLWTYKSKDERVIFQLEGKSVFSLHEENTYDNYDIILSKLNELERFKKEEERKKEIEIGREKMWAEINRKANVSDEEFDAWYKDYKLRNPDSGNDVVNENDEYTIDIESLHNKIHELSESNIGLSYTIDNLKSDNNRLLEGLKELYESYYYDNDRVFKNARRIAKELLEDKNIKHWDNNQKKENGK